MKHNPNAEVGSKYIVTHNIPSWGVIDRQGEIATLVYNEPKVSRYTLSGDDDDFAWYIPSRYLKPLPTENDL